MEPLDSTDGLVMRPLPFKASFEPRDQNAREIIEMECDTTHQDLADLLAGIGDDFQK